MTDDIKRVIKEVVDAEIGGISAAFDRLRGVTEERNKITSDLLRLMEQQSAVLASERKRAEVVRTSVFRLKLAILGLIGLFVVMTLAALGIHV